MASQGERVPGVDIDVVLDPMVQDEIPEQEMLVVEEQELPQMDLEPEMGAAAAAVHDTSPFLLHQNPPPIPAETAHPSAPDMAQLFAMLAEMTNKMDTNANKLKEEMKEEIKKQHERNERGNEKNAG